MPNNIAKVIYMANSSATPEVWMDSTPATAAAADILAPKTAMLADGVLTTGTGTGGGGSVAAKDVNFIDYDGTILHSYTKSEFANLSDLPANPSHTGLTAQGWNWTKQQITAQLTAMPNVPVWVGQMYTTSSGATEIDITLDDPDFLSPWLAIAPNGTVVVDWGDGSATDTMTGTGNSTSKYQQHVYAQTGSYTIKLTVSSGNFAFYNSSSNYAGVFRTINAADNRARSRAYSDKITAIRLGDGAKVSNYAFSYCYALQSITIPSTVTSINTTAFQYCYALQSITIPDSVTSIGDYVFTSCYALQSITIPSTVTSIGSSAFSYCYALQSITIPSGVTSIGSNVFNNCYALQSITIPSGVTIISNYAFNGCYVLQSITIPSTVTSIGNNAFYGCYALQNITIPSGVTSIGSSAFYNCNTLQSITIPSGVTSIGNYAFQNCNALQSITIPSGATSIGSNVFNGCYALQRITIPDKITAIQTKAFQYCYDMREYHFKATTPPTLDNTDAFSGIPSDCVIYVPYSADHSVLAAYRGATNWSTYASYMQEESS